MPAPVLRDPPDVTIVTGAAGWLGTALLTSLTAGDGMGARDGRIRALVQRPADVAGVAAISERLEVHVGDVTDAAATGRLLAGAEGATVFHCAGVIHPAHVDEFETVNVGGTRTVLEAGRRAGARRLVHVSSNSPFGVNPTPTDRFRAEEPFRPHLGYGRSKMEGERLVRAASGDGIETTVVRPPWFYGPRQPVRQTRFFTAVRTGRFPLVGDGTNRRSMVHVERLADGLIRAERVDAAAGRAYWVADRDPYPMAAVVATVRDALQAEGFEVSPRRPRLPGLAAAVAERLDGLLQARGRYVQELHVLSEMDKTIACDVSRAEDELGFVPATDLLDGMRASIRWCREQGIEL